MPDFLTADARCSSLASSLASHPDPDSYRTDRLEAVGGIPWTAMNAAPCVEPVGVASPHVDLGGDDTLVAETVSGSTDAFEELVRRHQSRVFSTARRYARREDEVEDIVQEVFLKAYERLPGFRFEAPFEHWLMRIAVHTCYDFLRRHQRTRECSFCDVSSEEQDWLERFRYEPGENAEDTEAARALVKRLMEALPPEFRMVIQLLEIEERSVREIHELTGWSPALIKVRAFRARAAMRRALARIQAARYL